MTSGASEPAEKLLREAIDIHIHTGPDVFPRLLDDVEAAKQAKEAGMKAILIKNHVTVTSDRAKIASDMTGLPVFGGLALNLSVGGINPQAVDMAVRMGARVIWMPTIHSAAYLKRSGHIPMFQKVLRPGLRGIEIIDSEGRLLPEIDEVLDLVAQSDVALATGHLSVAESMALVARAKHLKVKTIIVTHPLAPYLNYTVDEMVEILERGAAYLEHNMNDTTRQMVHPIQPTAIAQAIRAVGAERTIMATDGGQTTNPRPVAMFKGFIQAMLEHGISADDIKVMIRDNPGRVLGI